MSPRLSAQVFNVYLPNLKLFLNFSATDPLGKILLDDTKSVAVLDITASAAMTTKSAKLTTLQCF
jgi:hypothetical protein